MGRGSATHVVPIIEEVDSLDFSTDRVSAARYKSLETAYMNGRENAVSLLRVNVSLAIRKAFDRIVADRASTPDRS